MSETAQRREPLDGFAPISQRGKFTIEALAPRPRHVLRGPEDVAQAAGEAFGLALPTSINRASVDGDKAAFRLGPDEWFLIGAELSSIPTQTPHSLVAVGHRNTAIGISGGLSPDILASQVMLDLHPSAFPVGMATRTLFAKAEIILWRHAENGFHIEVWRSFADYVWGQLTEAAREHLK